MQWRRCNNSLFSASTTFLGQNDRKWKTRRQSDCANRLLTRSFKAMGPIMGEDIHILNYELRPRFWVTWPEIKKIRGWAIMRTNVWYHPLRFEHSRPHNNEGVPKNWNVTGRTYVAAPSFQGHRRCPENERRLWALILLYPRLNTSDMIDMPSQTGENYQITSWTYSMEKIQLGWLINSMSSRMHTKTLTYPPIV